MSDLKSLFAAKAKEQEEKARSAALSLAASPSSPASPSSSVTTGMQGSTDTVPVMPTVRKIEPKFDPELAKDCLDVFEDFKLRKFFTANGRTVRSIGGFFYAKDLEELKMLKHYVKTGHVGKAESEK